mgnify:FL=1|tara:strand:- start:95 stop:367 length:273 start_codon:yes stop_codon:yes gene_type:complete
MIKKILIIATFLTIISLAIISYIRPAINEVDACLCTEILSNDSFLSNKNKMPSVDRCITTFKNFEKAHLKCIESYEFKHPKIKVDSLKSV